MIQGPRRRKMLCVTFGSKTLVTSKLQSKTNTVALKGWTSCKCDAEGRRDAAGEVGDTDELRFALSPVFQHQIK